MIHLPAQAASVCDYPTPGDTVEVFYTGRLRKSGGVFDSKCAAIRLRAILRRMSARWFAAATAGCKPARSLTESMAPSSILRAI